jgi:hypothetical protein
MCDVSEARDTVEKQEFYYLNVFYKAYGSIQANRLS